LDIEIIDTHAHLDMPEFDPDRAEVINRATDAGVATIITVGINLESDRRAVQLAEKYPGVQAALGFHPQDSKGVKKEDIDSLAEMARHPRVRAIGEIGLDFYRHYSSREEQVQVLCWQLELAKKLALPVIIHCRQAQEEILPVLRNWSDAYRPPDGKARGVLHCFNVGFEIAEQYLDMGFFISLGAYIGYPSSAKLRETIKSIPSDRLVIETDCPFLPPQKYRGKRNEPSYTLITAGVLAEIKKVSLEEIARQTTQNAILLFNLPEMK
jgi:TatD DNase family protein